jgi:hypothetical protein
MSQSTLHGARHRHEKLDAVFPCRSPLGGVSIGPSSGNVCPRRWLPAKHRGIRAIPHVTDSPRESAAHLAGEPEALARVRSLLVSAKSPQKPHVRLW